MGTDIPARHKWLNFFGVWCIILAFIVTVTFNGLSGGAPNAIFNSDVGNISDKYNLDITPAGWTFSIWGLIYFSIAANLIFLVVLLFKQNSYGYLYLNPEIITPAFTVVYSFNFACNTAWIFAWDRELIVVSSYLLFDIAITNIISIGILAYNINKHRQQLSEENPKTYWAYIVLSLNGQGLYVTWTIVASFVNFSHALHYKDNISMLATSNVFLSMLLVSLVIWAILDNTLFDKYSRFLYTPYIVVIWALCGIHSAKNNDPNVPSMTKDFFNGLIGIAALLFFVKIVVTAYRQIKSPLNKVEGIMSP